MRTKSYETNAITVRLDRLQITAPNDPDAKPPQITGFRVVRDSFVRCQTTTATYARCREYKSLTNDTRLFWQYQRRKAWLKAWKVTFVADDHIGLLRREIQAVLAHCRSYALLTVELAFDFRRQPHVDAKFIRRHAVFGKSHVR